MVVKGVQTVDRRVLRRVLFGWLGTPTLAALVSATFSYVAMWLD